LLYGVGAGRLLRHRGGSDAGAQCDAGGGTANPALALTACTGAAATDPDPEAGAGTTKPEAEAWLVLDAVAVGVDDDGLCATRFFT
jgi:hypothetical protein